MIHPRKSALQLSSLPVSVQYVHFDSLFMVRYPGPFLWIWYLGEQGSCVTDIPLIYVG